MTDPWTIIAAIVAILALLWGLSFGQKTMIEVWGAATARRHLHKISSAQEIHRGDTRMTAVAFGDHGKILAFGGFSGVIHIHAFGKSKGPREVRLHSGPVRSIVFSSRQPQQMYSVGDDGSLFRIDLEARTFVQFARHMAPIYAVALSPDEDLVMCGTREGRVLLWDTRAVAHQPLGAEPHGSFISPREEYVYPSGAVFSVAFGQSGQFIRLAGSGGSVIEIDRTSHQQRLIADLPETVFSIAADASGAIYAGCSNGVIYRCDNPGRQEELRGHTGAVRWLLLDERSNRLISGSKDKTIRVWDLGTGGHHIYSDHRDYVYQIALSPDGGTLASASGDGSIRIRRI